MKYTFDHNTFALISTVGEEVWVQGDNNTKVLQFYFTDTEPITDYECRAIIKRANGDVSNELYCTPINSGSDKYYKLAIKGWVTDHSGTVEITVRRKKFNIVTNEYDIITYGLITKDVSEGVLPETSNTITEEQYLMLLVTLSQMEPQLVTNLGYIDNFDDIVIDGLYQFAYGVLLVETIGEITKQYKLQLNDKNLPSTKQFNGIAEHRYLDNDIWSAWNDEIGVESIVSTFGKFGNVEINESLSVGADISANEIFSSYNQTNTLKVNDKVLGSLKIEQDLEVGRDLDIKRDLAVIRNTTLQGDLAVGGIGIFEQSPKSLDNPTNDVDLTPKKYVDDLISSVNSDVEEIMDGTVAVKKAERDSQNNVIHTHYATKDELTGHDNNPNAHLSIRQEIEEVAQDVARIEGRGKSYGELNYTQSDLEAMTESTRNAAILVDIEGSFPDYTLNNGDLVYTKEVDDENTHEWEYNDTLSTWVDNGAYTVQKASNSIFGTVKGDGDYINIVNGILEILKSNYATRVGDSTNSYTYSQLKTLIENLQADVNDRYTKSQVYTKVETNALLDELKAVYGWEKGTIWELEGVSGTKTLPLADFQDYNILIVQKVDTGLTLSITRSDPLDVNDIINHHNGGLVIAYDDLIDPTNYIEYNSGLEVLTFVDTNGLYNIYGLKMKPLPAADKVAYDNSLSGLDADNVQEAIDELENEIEDINENVDTLEKTVNKNNLETNHRVTTLEETLRKSMSNDIQNNVNGVGVISLGKDVANAPITVEIKGDTQYSGGNELAVNFNKRITSVGANLFSAEAWYNLLKTGNETIYPTSFGNDGTYNYIKVNPEGHNALPFMDNKFLPNIQYTISFNGKADIINYTGIIFEHTDMTVSARYINSTTWGVFTLTSTAGKTLKSIRLAYSNTSYGYYANIQLNYGAAVLPYQPYKTTELYLQPNVKGYGVPSIQDKIVYRNGKYYHQKNTNNISFDGRVDEDWENYSSGMSDDFSTFTVNISGKKVGYQTSISNLFVNISGGWDNPTVEHYSDHSGIPSIYLIISNSKIGASAGDDNATRRSKLRTWLSANNFKVTYQLATPIETEILSSGIPLGFENGTVYVEDIIADVDIYTDKVQVTNTNYTIKSIDSIIKLNPDGTQTKLNVTSAVIALDKLSFTHPSLSVGDVVVFTYVYESTNSIEPNTTVYYYDNKFVVVAPNGTVYRWKVNVDNSGVATLTTEVI